MATVLLSQRDAFFSPMGQVEIEMPAVYAIFNNIGMENDTVVGKTCTLDAFLPSTVSMALTPLIAWGVLVLAGTFLEKSPFVALSLRRSMDELLTGRQSRLNFLDCFRVVAIFWVMMNHTGSEGRIDILERLPSADKFKSNVHNHPIFGALLGNSALGVEIFLVLSGLLAARSWLRVGDKPFWAHYKSFIGRRILRLIPSIAFFIYIAIGPIVKTVLPRYHSTMISDCGLKGVLSHLTFLGNWQSTPTCMGYLWYLGLDMQLYMIAPVFLHLLHRIPKLGFTFAGVTVVASCFIRAAYCTAYGVCNKSDVDIPFISYPDSDPAEVASVYAGLWDMYARPYTKCGPFVLGLLMGYVTMVYKTELSARATRTLFLSGLSLAVGTIYAILPEYWHPEQGDNLYNISYTALFRTVFAIAVLMMVAALYYRKESVEVHPYWSVLARLTFNAYLVHMPMIYFFNHLQYLQDAHGALELLVVLPFVALVSFISAALFYLFVESPIGNVSSQWASKIGL